MKIVGAIFRYFAGETPPRSRNGSGGSRARRNFLASRKEKREKEGKKGKIVSVVEERRREGRIPSFVKDSLTRSLLASGIISRGAGLRISDNGGLDYATTLFPPFFPRLSPLLFFPSPFSPPSFSLSLFYHCPGISPSDRSFCVPLEIGRHLADGDFRVASDSRIPQKFVPLSRPKSD